MKQVRREEINKIVAVDKGEQAYLLTNIFDHGDGFVGACGATIVPVYQEQIDERNDVENLKSDYDYLWREAVKSESTDKGLDEYIEELVEMELNCSGKYFFGQDDSYIYRCETELRELFPDAVTFECIGGGRIFERGQKFDRVLRPDLIARIDEVEKPAAPKLKIAE